MTALEMAHLISLLRRVQNLKREVALWERLALLDEPEIRPWRQAGIEYRGMPRM